MTIDIDNSYLQIMLVEYQEAWANTRHYDIVFRNTLIVIISFSIASMALNSEKTELLQTIAYYGCWLSIGLNLIGIQMLLKIQDAYKHAFSRLNIIESELNRSAGKGLEVIGLQSKFETQKSFFPNCLNYFL